MNRSRRTTIKRIIRIGVLAFPLAVIALFSTQSLSCEEELEGGMDGPLSFEVRIVSGDVGAERDRLAYHHEEREYVLNIRAVDQDGSAADWFDGWVHLDVAPNGTLAHRQEEWIELKDGIAENVTVRLRYLHSKTEIWIEDIGCDDTSCEGDESCPNNSPCCNCYPGGSRKPGSYATGLSPTIWVENPTIRNIRQPDGLRDVPLLGDFVDIRIDDRIVVVTGVTNDGFYATDVSDPDGIYNGIYAYNHSRPRDISEGDLLRQLSGQVDLYYGFTELGFPSWKVSGHDESRIPAPVLITYNDVIDNEIMARYESRPVRVEDVTVCEPGNEYDTYGQWPVILPGGLCPSEEDRWGDGVIKVVSSATAPEYNPREMVGEIISFIEGNLRYHVSAGWMIYTRDAGDLGGEGNDYGNY